MWDSSEPLSSQGEGFFFMMVISPSQCQRSGGLTLNKPIGWNVKQTFDKRKIFLQFVFSLSLCFFSVAQAAENPLAYRPLPTPKKETLAGEGQNVLVKVVLLPLSFYAKILSSVDGDRCPSYPNCSLYARQALTRHGAILGLWMTVDRLIHERTELIRGGQEGRLLRFKDGRVRVFDSLESNDFWLHDP